MSFRQKDLENVGEWQIDENGKRFRMIGGFIKEYETIVHTTCGDIPKSLVNEVVQRNKDFSKKLPEKNYMCPFRGGQSCFKECVFFSNGSCVFGEHEPKVGSICPFNKKQCTDSCRLYGENGCRF